ncbi:MAG: hypothetical protein MUF87_01305 [Anaerolineae bacterium]|jgi:DNA repair exonuclease SbcCD ATPase subunit|nr:hypothetical protein [Anaerolineae bacterium]
MNDLLKKLNTLVRAGLNDITPSLPRFEREPNLDRQVSELRQRINESLEHEDDLQAQVNALHNEVARLDAAADQAVEQGRESEARQILAQLKRAEQRLAFAESDLRSHRRAVEELIGRVNLLEAAVGDKKAAEQAAASPPPPVTTDRATPETAANPAQPIESTMDRISKKIAEAQEKTRERIHQMGDLLNAQTTPAPPSSEPSSTKSAEDELSERLRRLSKPE